MNKFNLTNEDFEKVRLASDRARKNRANEEELKSIYNEVKEYQNTVEKMGDGRRTKGYQFSDEELDFMFNYSTILYYVFG